MPNPMPETNKQTNRCRHASMQPSKQTKQIEANQHKKQLQKKTNSLPLPLQYVHLTLYSPKGVGSVRGLGGSPQAPMDGHWPRNGGGGRGDAQAKRRNFFLKRKRLSLEILLCPQMKGRMYAPPLPPPPRVNNARADGGGGGGESLRGHPPPPESFALSLLNQGMCDDPSRSGQ